MANVNSPLLLQSLLSDINGRRALALALRAQEGRGGEMVSGRYVPNMRAIGGPLARGLFGDPLQQLQGEEQGALNSYGDELAGATEGLLGAEGLSDNAEFAKRVARAQTAGVPQDYVKGILDRRQSWQMLNQMLAGLESPASGVAAGGGGGGPPAGRGAAGGGMPLPPAGGAPAAPGAAPGGAPAFAGAMGAQGGGTPLANVPDGKLITMAAIMPDGPAKALAVVELKAREVKIDQGGLVTRGGRPIGMWKDGVFVDPQGRVEDVTGSTLAARAGATAAAEADARQSRTPIETTDPRGRKRTVFPTQLPGYPGAGAAGGAGEPQAAAGGGGRMKVNFEGTPDEIRRYVEIALRENASPAAGAQGGALGVGPDPIEQKAREADVENVAAGRRKLFEGQAAALDKGLADARQAAEVNLPAIQTARSLLDSGKVKTGLGANWALGFGRALSAAGLSEGEGVAATQAFVAQAAKRVMGVIKMLGSGSGISDADREYAAKAVGGNITMDEKAIRRILDIDERAQRAYISYHNKNVDRAKSFFQTPEQEAFYRVEVPAGASAATGGAPKTVRWSDLP